MAPSELHPSLEPPRSVLPEKISIHEARYAQVQKELARVEQASEAAYTELIKVTTEIAALPEAEQREQQPRITMLLLRVERLGAHFQDLRKELVEAEEQFVRAQSEVDVPGGIVGEA